MCLLSSHPMTFGRKETGAQHCHGFTAHRHQVPNFSSFCDSHIESCSYSKPDYFTRGKVDKSEASAWKWAVVFRVWSWFQRSRACPGPYLWGGAGLHGHTEGWAHLRSAFYCFHQSCYDLLSTRVSSVSDSPVLKWFKWEKGNIDADNILVFSHSR